MELSSVEQQSVPTRTDNASAELGLLSAAALRLAELPPQRDVFQLIADEIAALLPDSLVLTNSYDREANRTVVRAIAGPLELTTELRGAFGQEVAGISFPIDDASRREMQSGNAGLARLEGGLHQLTFYTLPVEFCRELEHAFQIRSVYAQPFTRGGELIGTVAILSRAPALQHFALIETFTRLATVAIQLRRAGAMLDESERKFRMFAESSQDTIFRFRLKPHRELEYVSPACLRLMGYTPQELYEDPASAAQLVHPDDLTKLGAGAASWEEPFVVTCRRKDGVEIWTEQRLTPIRNDGGELVAVQGIARDMTQRKLADQGLIDADHRKTEFLGVLSHELRNPLTPIRNSLFILDRAPAGGEQARRARAVIERQLELLTRLIDDLLDVTRITRGKVQLHRARVEVNELVRVAVEDHRSTFESGGIQLEMTRAPVDLWVNGDATRITQVVGNLLLNAAKFTPPGGRTVVTVRKDVWKKQAVIQVQDTGAGVPAEMLPRIFEPFMQATQTLERSKGGLGLGLALVKGLVELHGGSVSVYSPGPGVGTELTVRLPLEETQAESDARAKEPVRRRVLVIEDNVDAANSLRDALELIHHEVDVAFTGPEGIEKAKAMHPDVILCDIGLPQLDGYAVARALRADPDLRDTPLVALTGYAGPEEVQKCDEAGFDRHLAKPPAFDVLERLVASIEHH